MQSPRGYSDLEGYFKSPEDAPAKLLIMLRAYFDESGHESDGGMFLAGFIGNEEQWKDFVPKWRTALGSQRKFLHMKKLRWKKDSTRDLLARLGPVPYECGLEGCMAGVRYSDYADLVAGTEDEKLFKGWATCFMPMVMQILRGTPRSERIEFIFEQQDEYEPFVNAVFPLIARAPTIYKEDYKLTPDGRSRIAKWGFVPKGSTVMTDPADYLAFALREWHTNSRGIKADLCRPILQFPNGETREGYGTILSREKIRRMINRARARQLETSRRRSEEATGGEIEMMTMRERYQNDQAFSRLVDMMLATIMEGNFTPTEIREAAMLAQIRYEELHPRQTTFTREQVMSGKV